ncbi:MAG: TetR/AcrR family transcriptional regulator [Nannocystaceae bacterium]|nr:TetR/AcrR family transcriptional regulator [bacterium]
MVYRPTAKTRARKEAQRELLLGAARSLVAQRGFAGASMQAVAREAGVATGTLYRYFPSKADLFVEVFTAVSSHEVQTMARATEGHTTATEALGAAIRTWASRAFEGRTLAYALIAEPVMPEVEAARLRLRRDYVEVLKRTLVDGCERGEFSLRSVDVAAAAIVGALAEGVVGPLCASDTPTSRDALIADLTHFCLQAVTPSRPS